MKLLIRISEAKGGANSNNSLHYYLRGTMNNHAMGLFPSKQIIVSYTGNEVKIKEATLNQKSTKISKNGMFNLSKIDDRHNWIGKYELLQDDEWYILERITE
jgi:hypothetical protein